MHLKVGHHNILNKFLNGLFVPMILITLLAGCGTDVEKRILANEKEGFIQDSNIKNVEQLLKEAAGSVMDWENFATRRYEKFGKDLYTRFNAFSPQFLPLLVDVGIAIRADEFLNFAAANNLDKSKPWEAREAFSKKLGKKTYYRGLLLNEDEFNAIKTKGIQSSSLRRNISPAQSINSASLVTQISDRLVEQNTDKDPFMSISENFDIARSVPCASENADVETKKVYVFNLSIPVLDTFSTDMKKDWFIENFKRLLRENGKPENEVEKAFFPAAIESFVTFQIPVHDFTAVDVMAKLTPSQCVDIQQAARP